MGGSTATGHGSVAPAVHDVASRPGPRAAGGLVVGVDVGGTFTDCLVLDPASGDFAVAKVPSTPQDQSLGFMAGLPALETANLRKTQSIVHGTTVATNAVLERKGARCGLITTAAFATSSSWAAARGPSSSA